MISTVATEYTCDGCGRKAPPPPGTQDPPLGWVCLGKDEVGWLPVVMQTIWGWYVAHLCAECGEAPMASLVAGIVAQQIARGLKVPDGPV